MGYADALLMLGLSYGSNDAIEFTKYFMGTLRDSTLAESELLASERGSCALMLLPNGCIPRRNASLMAIPANGTLSLIGNVTGGIEPIFTYLTKRVVEDKEVHQLQPTFRQLLLERNCNIDLVISSLQRGVPMCEIDAIDNDLRKVCVSANELSYVDHIKTQATFQKYIDGGISKTINLESSITSKEIGDAIHLARESGCVGIALYRNGSVDSQPMQILKNS